ncbi:hypothetical protein ACQKLP_18040 [Chitinophaga sp. NPDC101104]|uniref:hypothetical protein n=1 Tax=Chitinophaga sp. NPDC101104 TaxID=3390561 RepID=UPI003CFE3AD3
MATIRQLQATLRLTYGLVPIVAGLDKFTNLLAQWSDYLGTNGRLIPFDPAVFMKAVGIIEIIAGILVLAIPRIGAFVVMAWLLCIAAQLVVSGHYFDVAVRDIVMAIGAWTLAQLSKMQPSNAE